MTAARPEGERTTGKGPGTVRFRAPSARGCMSYRKRKVS